MFKQTEDIFNTFNHVFAVFDKEFRDAERRLGVRNALPSVTVPGIKTNSKYDYIQTYDDGEKQETYKNGKLHGEVLYHNGKTPSEYFLEGRQVDKVKWIEYMQKLEDDRPHYITIDNRDYVITGKQYRALRSKLEELTKLENK
jgi:hypothetical protein